MLNIENNLQINKSFRIMGETNVFVCTATYLTCMHCQAEMHMTHRQVWELDPSDKTADKARGGQTERQPGGATDG